MIADSICSSVHITFVKTLHRASHGSHNEKRGGKSRVRIDFSVEITQTTAELIRCIEHDVGRQRRTGDWASHLQTREEIEDHGWGPALRAEPSPMPDDMTPHEGTNQYLAPLFKPLFILTGWSRYCAQLTDVEVKGFSNDSIQVR